MKKFSDGKWLLSFMLALLMMLVMLPVTCIQVHAQTTGSDDKYLTFTGTADFKLTISFLDGVTLQYATADPENGSNWKPVTSGTEIEVRNKPYVLYLRGTDNRGKQLFDNGHHLSIESTGNVACSGNIMTLLDYNAPDQAQMGDRCFSYMFMGCSSLTAAPALPATELADYCYRLMFSGCSSLTAAPALPATTLKNRCYESMFHGCSSLTAAPALPATTLKASCYCGMFSGCSSLTAAPALPATMLEDGCYYCMFQDCSSLTAAPALPARELKVACYYNMFNGCTSLTSVPELPATTLANSCYSYMFNGCTGIRLSNDNTNGYDVPYSITSSGTGMPADNAVYRMFEGTGGAFQGTPEINKTYYMKVDYLTFTPVAEEGDSTVEYTVTINLKEGCSLEYSKNGGGWTDYTNNTSITLNKDEYVRFRGRNNKNKQLFDLNNHVTLTGKVACSGNIMTLLDYNHPDQAKMGQDCFYFMFYGCSGLTTAPALPATELAEYCYYGMFYGCSSLTAAPALPATTLADGCYSYMFNGCSSLTAAPALPATELADYCYQAMFRGCSSLTAAPALPATKLANYCYGGMFFGCTGLTAAPELPATTLADCCYAEMFAGCSSLTAAPALPVTELAESCYSHMFSGCSSLTAAPALPATKLAKSCYDGMFGGCSSLTAAPALPAGELAVECYEGMFRGCSSLTAAPALPATELADFCYYEMFSGCTGIKLSATKKDYYTEEYRIPSSGTETLAEMALNDMFSGTGGDFKGTPYINTTYYMDIGLAKVPVITTQPADLTLKYGASSNNILGVQVEAEQGHTLSYQWYSNTTNSNEGGTAIQNATGSSYTIPSDTAIGTSYFYCVITATREVSGKTAEAVSNVAAVSVGKAVPTDYSVPILTGTSLSLNGSALYLIETAGSSAQGKLYYAVTESAAEPDVWTDNVSAITAEKAGKFYVWYKISDSEYYELTPTKLDEVTVTIVPVNEITLNEDNLELTVGSTVTLKATVTPDNATYPSVTWTSDKESVATVENGVITAVSAGTATITANAGGKSATCTVTVKAKNNSGYIPVTPSYPSDDKNNTNNDGPKIVGNGISGWDNIAAEIKKTPEGGKVTIDMAGATTIPSSVLNAVKGKNVDIILDMDDGIKWTINGKSVTYILWNIDMGVTVGKSGIPVKVINNITGEKYNVVISLAHNGPFGFKATLTINMRRQDAGLIANLFYYNRTTKKLEYVCGGKIMDDGSVSLQFSHASDYTIIVDDHILGKELTAKVGRTGNVKLSWTAQDSAESYEVYQVIDGKWVKLGTTTKTTYTVKGIKNNKTCKFMVRYNVGGNLSAKSDSLKLKLKVYYKPALKATKSDGKLTLTWKEVPGATKYRIYAVKNDKLVKLKNTKLLTYSMSSKAGKTYRFAVKAYVNGKWTRIETSDIIKVKVK